VGQGLPSRTFCYLHISIVVVTQRPALTSLHQEELELLDGRGHRQHCNLIPVDGDVS
jgi:hypothetical protein